MVIPPNRAGTAERHGRDSVARRWIVAMVAAMGVVLPCVATAQTPGPTASASIVGEWVGVHDCDVIVTMLAEAGLEEFVLEQIWGNGLLPGASSDADIPDPSEPCTGTIAREHSHFFTADGVFGSRDYDGQQVDDGTYVLLPGDVIEINGARFAYSIDGDSLILEPELPDVSGCTDMECRFPAAWMLMVALPGSTWTRSTALPEASPSASPS